MSAELTSTAPPACPVAGVELPVVVLGVVDIAGGVVARGLVELVSRRAGVVVTGGFAAVVSRGADGFALVSCVVSGATSGQAPSAELQRMFFLQLRVLGSTMGTRDELRQLVRLLDVSGVRPRIDRVLPLAEAREGFAAMADGEQVGKIVFNP